MKQKLVNVETVNTQLMDRRSFNKRASALAIGLLLPLVSQAKTYLTADQAKRILWGDTAMAEVAVTLTEDQVKSISKASKVRVRNPRLQLWKTVDGGWFVLDQVIGKHENIDMAYALDADGKVLGLEILTYRETYGDEVMHPKWRQQFHGRDSSQLLKLDKQIKNISGATLSCRHVTEGINRLTHTWEQVLQYI